MWLFVIRMEFSVHEGNWFTGVYVMMGEGHVSLGVVEANHDETNAAYQLLLERDSTQLRSLHRP